MFGFTNLATKFTGATFHRALGFHATIANETAGFLFDVTFEFSCASARSIFPARFHTKQYSVA